MKLVVVKLVAVSVELVELAFAATGHVHQLEAMAFEPRSQTRLQKPFVAELVHHLVGLVVVLFQHLQLLAVSLYQKWILCPV